MTTLTDMAMILLIFGGGFLALVIVFWALAFIASAAIETCHTIKHACRRYGRDKW